MSWNYRILAKEENGELYYNVHEVYYENGLPRGYSANAANVCGETVKGLKWAINRMKEATNKPVLWYGDKFPQEL